MTYRQMWLLKGYLVLLALTLTVGSYLIHRSVTVWTKSTVVRVLLVAIEVALLAPAARFLSCCGWHQVYPGNCASHVGHRRSVRCLLVEFFSLGYRGHTWKVLGGVTVNVSRRPWSLLYSGVVVWPFGVEPSGSPRIQPVMALRPDLPLPARMHAICTRCGVLWSGPEAKPLDLIDRIASLSDVVDDQPAG